MRILISFINTLIFTIFFKQKTIVTIDIQGIISEYILKISSENLTEKEISEKVLSFTQKLENTLKHTASKNNIILMPQQVVFGGVVRDITNEFKKEVMKNEK